MAGSRFNFYLTVVEKEGPLIKLWGHLDKNTVEYIDNYLGKLDEQFSKGGGKPYPSTISVGQMCCALYNGIFYRARVISVANVSVGLVVVRFVDFGNSAITSIENLRLVDEQLARIPPQATDFYLYGVTPLTGTDLDVITTDYMKQNLCYKDFEAYLVIGINEKRVIKIHQNGVDYGELMVAQKFALAMDHQLQESILRGNASPSLNATVVPAQQWHMQAHVPSTQFSHKAPTVQNSVYDAHGMPPGRASPHPYGVVHAVPSPGEMTVKTFTSPILEPNSEHNIYVSNVEDGPLSFAVQLQAAEQTLIAVTADIAAHRSIPLREPPVPGSVCLARFPGDTKLSRATIMEVMDSTCRLYYVDFGNISDVPYTDIFELPAKLINPKAMALRFCLAGLKKGPPPTNITKEAFKDVVRGCLLRLRVAPSPEGPPLKQYGYLFREGRDVRVLYEELAKERSRNIANVPAVVSYPRAPIMYQPAKADAVIDGTWVTISYLNSPDEFWVQLETDQSDLEQVMALLDEYCSQSKKIPSVLDLKVKSPMFARFSEDDRWYRACILKVETGSEGLIVQVEFVDYGNEEGITDMGRLRLAEPSIVSALAAQAVRCRLNGAANVRCKVGVELWDQISTKFSDLTLESRGMVKLGPRGVGDPVVVVEELRDDTLSPPVVITMDALYKAVIGSVSEDTSGVNPAAVYSNSTSGCWKEEKKTIKDFNANPTSSYGGYSGNSRPFELSKAKEESGTKSWEVGSNQNEGRGRRVGGRNGNQEIGNWDGDSGGSQKENGAVSPPYRGGRNAYHNSGDNWDSNKDVNGPSEKGGGFGGGGGYFRGGRRNQDLHGWNSGRLSDSDGGEGHHGDRGGRRGGRGGGYDSFSHGGGNGGGYRGGRYGGRDGGGYGGRSNREDGDWENKDTSGQNDGEGGRGGYHGGRGGRGWGGNRGDRGSRSGWEDRDSFRKKDDDSGFGGGWRGGRGGYRGGRDRDGEWDGGGRTGRGGRHDGGGDGWGGHDKFGSQSDDGNSGFGGGGYHGNRGREGGDRPKRYGNDGCGGFGDSRGGRGGRGGRDGGYSGGWKDSNSNDTEVKDTFQSTFSSVVESGETWEDNVVAAEPGAVAAITTTTTTTATTPSGQIVPQTVEVGSVEQVNVVFVESRVNFFIQLKCQAEKLDTIATILSENYATIGEETEEKVGTEESVPSSGQLAKAPQINPSELHVGMPCAALYSEDGVWYRACVEREPTVDGVSVSFVDYGNKGDVTEGNVRKLPHELCSLPAQAICCSLVGLDHLGGEGDEELDVEFETEVISGESAYAITFVKRAVVGGNECVEVVLRNKDTEECVNSRFGGSIELSLPADPHIGSNSMPLEVKNIPKPYFEIGCTIDVEIVYVASRREFYCQAQSSAEQLSAVMDNLASICAVEGDGGGEIGGASKKQMPKASQISITSVEVGVPCAALYSDKVWYRAVVDGEPTEEGLSVRFVDYGNQSDVAEGCLRELPAEMRVLPAQAIYCCLLGVSEESGEEAEAKDVEFEIQVTSGESSYTATFVKRSMVGQNECMEVLLKNKDTGECVNSQFGGSDEVTETFGESFNKTDFLTAIPKLDLVIGSTVDVDIVYVASRREFYCQPKESAEELQEVMNKLATMCTTEEEEVAPPCESTLRMFGLKPGMFCAALFMEDSVWYRAQVLDEPKVKETGSGFVINVKFIDFGNEAEVEESGIRELIPALSAFPAQAIPCCLLGLVNGFVLDSDKEIEFESVVADPEISLEALFVGKATESDHMEVVLRNTGAQDSINQQFGAIGELTGGSGFGLRPAMPADQSLEVSVIWFVSPFRFYVQPVDWAKDLVLYMESLQKVEKKSIFPWPPTIGTPVLARFIQDGGLYRAVVEDIGANSTVRVQYIDYGNRESLMKSQVWAADPCFKTKSPQAIACALRGISPISDGWPLPGSPESSLDKYFSLEKCSCIFHSRVADESKVSDGIEGETRIWVSLLKPDGTSVADELVAAGLATHDSMTMHLESKSSKGLAKSPQTKLMESSGYTSKSPSKDIFISKGVCFRQPVVPLETASTKTEKKSTDEDGIEEVEEENVELGEELDVDNENGMSFCPSGVSPETTSPEAQEKEFIDEDGREEEEKVVLREDLNVDSEKGMSFCPPVVPPETASPEAQERESIHEDEREELEEENAEFGEKVNVEQIEEGHDSFQGAMLLRLVENDATFPLDNKTGDSSVKAEANISVRKDEVVCDGASEETESLPNAVVNECSEGEMDVEELSKVDENELLGPEKQKSVSAEIAEDQTTRESATAEIVMENLELVKEKLSEILHEQVKTEDKVDPSLDIKLAVEKLSDVHKDILRQQAGSPKLADELCKNSKTIKTSEGPQNNESEVAGVIDTEVSRQSKDADIIEESNLLQSLETGPESLDLVMNEFLVADDYIGEPLSLEVSLELSATDVFIADNKDALDESENFEDAEDTTTSELAKDVLKSSVDGDKDAAARVQQVVERYYQETPKPLPIDKIQIGGDYFVQSPADCGQVVPVKVVNLSGTLGAVVEFKEGYVDEVPLDKIYECPPEMAVLLSPEASPMTSLTLVGDCLVSASEDGQIKSLDNSELKREVEETKNKKGSESHPIF